MHTFPEYIPIATSLFSIYFTIEIGRHYLKRKTLYLLWWTIGVITFGMGTITESVNVLAGWSPLNTKIWYIVGALLGGFPLAQGSVYLLMNKKFARITSWIFTTVIIVAGVAVMLSPVTIPEGFDYKLTGAVLSWEWVRKFSPFINSYAALFLVGGAIYSAVKYARQKNAEARFKGNIFIALGGLLPGIGGTMTRFGQVNVLFVTEFIGLVMIYTGYRIIRNDKSYATVTEPVAG